MIIELEDPNGPRRRVNVHCCATAVQVDLNTIYKPSGRYTTDKIPIWTPKTRGSPCEYCGAPLPFGVNRETRRIRSRHFAYCEARPRAGEAVQADTEPTAKDLEDFIEAAGFSFGWGNLESWARRMAEHGVREIKRLRGN